MQAGRSNRYCNFKNYNNDNNLSLNYKSINDSFTRQESTFRFFRARGTTCTCMNLSCVLTLCPCWPLDSIAIVLVAEKRALFRRDKSSEKYHCSAR